MIRYVEEAQLPKLLSVLERDAFGIKISGCVMAYGIQQFSEYWIQMDDTGLIYAAIGRLDSALTLCTSPSIFTRPELCNELEMFCNMLPGQQSILMDMRLPTSLAITRTGVYMEFDSTADTNDISEHHNPRISSLYELLSSCDSTEIELPPYAAFAVDMSHRFRHGIARCWGIWDKEQLNATVFTTAETERYALIGGVATRPILRGQGLSSSLLRKACTVLCREGKTPVLFCMPELQAYYEKLGFHVVGQWAESNLTAQARTLNCAVLP